VEVHALRKRGWSISAIARHTGRDRKTVRAYLNDERTPGVRKRREPDPFEPFVDYVTCQLAEDPHLWARTLCDELEELGYRLSYPTLTRQIRDRGLRPVCKACATATDRANAIIDHPAGEEALCGVPHKVSYEEPDNMRRPPGRVDAGLVRRQH